LLFALNRAGYLVVRQEPRPDLRVTHGEAWDRFNGVELEEGAA
jgi:hypothetical protein